MLTILYLYYNQPKAITFFQELSYHQLKQKFLFVDDASKQPLTLKNWQNADVFRIKTDIPWNQPAANNLGFWHLYNQNPEATVLRMDIDHYFTPEALQEIAKIQLQSKQIYQFSRKNTTPHPNIYLARVHDLLSVGGYNEAFCGNYGYDDKELNHRLRKQKFQFIVSPIICNVNHSLKTPGLKRDTTVNHKKYLELIK